jgi:ribosome-binding protein aMBF1 (putative translation factor)
MRLSKAIQRAEEATRETSEYWAEALKLEFAIALEKNRKAAGLSCASLAERIKASAAYITKVLRGESNLTIESMVKLARAVDGHVRIEIVGKEKEAYQWGIADLDARAKTKRHVAPSSVTLTNRGIGTFDRIAA